MVSIEVNGKFIEAPEGSSVKQALEALGFKISMFPADQGLFMPCWMGGCWTCALDIDGQLRPACISTVKQGMKIKTDTCSLTPKRLVGGFMGHHVGGVGTPWWIKGDYIEVACFTAGCNFCCPQCQNWQFAYVGAGDSLTPEEAARVMTAARRRYAVDRIAISGGECTLNRPWLTQYLSHLKVLNPGASLHVDTNGSILTDDYLDDLVDKGMTDIGVDLKAMKLDTFKEITGLLEDALARRYMKTAWEAVEYLNKNHPQIFLGIGIPYNKDLIDIEEIEEMGERIARIDPGLQVCALDYRPEFRRLDISRPTYGEMMIVHEVLRGTGLETVICQTAKGRIGPDGSLLL